MIGATAVVLPPVRQAPLTLTLAMVLTLLASHLVLAADPPGQIGLTVPSDPVFTALMVDGTVLSGRVRQFSPEGDLTLVPIEGPERLIPIRQLVKLNRERPLPASVPEKQLVLLPEGDRLYRAVIGTATETALEVQSLTFGKVSIPLESLAGLVLEPPENEDRSFELVNRVRSEPRGSELLWLAPNGDRVSGGFLGLDEKSIRFQSGTGPITVEFSKVVALGFDASLVSYPMPDRPFAELTTTDGSRLGVTDLKVDQGAIVARTRFGAPIRLALNDLVDLHTRSDSLVYLTDREVAEAKYVAYLGPTRPFRRNSSVDGHPLRLGNQTYDRGLGTQSRTLLAYRLKPGDRRFQAMVGLDDRAGPLGSVVFRVIVDSREKYVSPVLSARDTPRMIDLDLEGAKLLILITEFGERGEIRDFANWVEARILR